MEAHARSPRALFEIKEHYEIPAFQLPYVWGEEDQGSPVGRRVRRRRWTGRGGGSKRRATNAHHLLCAVVYASKKPVVGDVMRHDVIEVRLNSASAPRRRQLQRPQPPCRRRLARQGAPSRGPDRHSTADSHRFTQCWAVSWRNRKGGPAAARRFSSSSSACMIDYVRSIRLIPESAPTCHARSVQMLPWHMAAEGIRNEERACGTASGGR